MSFSYTRFLEGNTFKWTPSFTSQFMKVLSKILTCCEAFKIGSKTGDTPSLIKRLYAIRIQNSNGLIKVGPSQV